MSVKSSNIFSVCSCRLRNCCQPVTRRPQSWPRNKDLRTTAQPVENIYSRLVNNKATRGTLSNRTTLSSDELWLPIALRLIFATNLKRATGRHKTNSEIVASLIPGYHSHDPGARTWEPLHSRWSTSSADRPTSRPREASCLTVQHCLVTGSD